MVIHHWRSYAADALALIGFGINFALICALKRKQSGQRKSQKLEEQSDLGDQKRADDLRNAAVAAVLIGGGPG